MKAIEFTEDGSGGLVLKLGSSASKTSRMVMKFECELFSCFPEEQETLFFGGDTELRIRGIMQWAEGKWRHYDKFMEPINALNRMINGRPLHDQSIWNNKKTQKWMNCVIKDHLHHQLSQSDQVETPQYVSSLVSYQMASVGHVRLNWNEMKSGYQWMSSVLNSHDNQLDIGNIAVLFTDSSSITFVVSDGVDLEEEEWKSVVNGLSIVHKMGLSMSIRFELSSDTARQKEMNMMAEGYLEMEQSKWQCRREENVLIFSIADDAEWEKQFLFFRQRAESMISGLKAFMRRIDERMQYEKQRKLQDQQKSNLERERQKLQEREEELKQKRRELEKEENELMKQRQKLDEKEKELEKRQAIERKKEVKRAAIFRSDSKTEWTDDMLETLRNEMQAEMIAQKAAAIDKMTRKQFEFRAPSIDQAQTSIDQVQTFAGQQVSNMMLPILRPFRMDSKTDWDENAIEKLREELKNEMMLQKQENIERWFNR